MKKQISKTKKLAAVLSGIMLCSLGVGVAINLNVPLSAQAVAVEFNDNKIMDRYEKGYELSVPQTQTVTYDGETYTAQAPALLYPSKKAIAATEVALDEVGEYTLVYTFNTDKGAMRAEKKFTVSGDTFEVTSDLSSVTYGKLTVANKGTVNGFQFDDYDSGEGLIVTLADGDVFRYNKPFNLAEYDGNGIIEMLLKDSSQHNTTKGGAGQLFVTLTDCYDSSNTVTLMLHDTGAANYYYMRAYASGQQETSCSVVTDLTKNYTNTQIYKSGYFANRQNYADFVENDWEYAEAKYLVYYGSVSGTAYGQNMYKGAFEWQFDYESKNVSVQMKDGYGHSVGNPEYPEFVTELDNADIYGADVFKGFTTGEVYLSIQGAEYATETTTIEIKSIFGNRDIAQSVHADVVAPVLTVDYQPTVGKTIYAAKGQPTKLFDAVATDLNLVGGVKTAVYYNYGTEIESKIPVTDGYFTPSMLGQYTIVYTAYDSFGNSAKVEIPVMSVVAEKGISIQTEELATMVAGQRVTLPEYTIVNVNASAAVDMEIIAKSANDERKIDTDTLSFTPLYAEEYEIIYRFSDNVYADEYSYKVTATRGSAEDSLIEGAVGALPRYFIKNLSYSIEKKYAYTFGADAPNTVLAKCAISYDEGATYTDVDESNFTITGDGSAIVKYYYGNASICSDAIPIIDVNYNTGDEEKPFQMEKYFQGDFVASATSTELTYQSNKKVGDNTLEFINNVALSKFILIMKVSEGLSNFAGLQVTLYDYYNRNVKTTMLYEEINGVLHFSVNGGWKYRLSGSMTDKNLRLANSGGMLSFGGSEAVMVDFGFSSDRCLMDISLLGIDGAAGISLLQLNGQTLAGIDVDFTRPDVFYKTMLGNRKLGEVVTVYEMSAIDVLSSVLDGDIYVSMRDPDRNILVSTDGVQLNNASALRSYQVKLDAYGEYRITYDVTDTLFNNVRVTVVLNVRDNVAPTATFIDGSVDGGKVEIAKGTSHMVKELSVSDNITAEKNIRIFVTVFDRSYQKVKLVNNSFTIKEGEEYTVVYLCYDEENNMTSVSYTIEAK